MTTGINLEYAKKLLEMRKSCVVQGDCSGCEYYDDCIDLFGNTNRVIEWLISTLEKAIG